MAAAPRTKDKTSNNNRMLNSFFRGWLQSIHLLSLYVCMRGRFIYCVCAIVCRIPIPNVQRRCHWTGDSSQIIANVCQQNLLFGEKGKRSVHLIILLVVFKGNIICESNPDRVTPAARLDTSKRVMLRRRSHRTVRYSCRLR